MPSRFQSSLAQVEGQSEERHTSLRPLIASRRGTVISNILDLNSDGEHPSAAHPHPIEGKPEDSFLWRMEKGYRAGPVGDTGSL